MTSWSKSWKEFAKGLRLDGSGRKLFLEPVKGYSGEIIPFMHFICIIKKHVLALDINPLMFVIFMLEFICEWLFKVHN